MTDQNLSAEQRSQVKSLWQKIQHSQNENRGQALHNALNKLSQQLIAIIPNDNAAINLYLVSMIKTKQFEEAIKFLESSPNISKNFLYEHAYILHRNGQNKNALEKILELQKSQKSIENTFKFQYLLSQINYKLYDYKKSIESYEKILNFQDEGQEIEKDELLDIITNYFACQSSISGSSVDKVEEMISKYLPQNQELTYEYFFNLSQIYLKEKNTEKALNLLRQAYEKAKSENQFQDDQTRFKVQEMHFLNQIYYQFTDIEYSAQSEQQRKKRIDGEDQIQTTWFEFSKTIKNNILVELNINSLSEIYPLDQQTFKESIGSLNWKKFAERINQQLKENQNLTQNQRCIMELNTVISFIKSNQFEDAKNLLTKIKKQPQFQQNTVFQSVFQQLLAYFFLKDKKYDEALQIFEKVSDDKLFGDVRLTLLKTHILFQMKKQKDAIMNLVNFIMYNMNLIDKNNNKEIINVNSLFIGLTLRLANNYKLFDSPEIKQFVKNIIDYYNKTVSSGHFDSQLLEVLISMGLTNEAFDLLEKYDISKIKLDKQVLGIYLELLSDKDIQKAIKVQRELDVLRPSDLFDYEVVEKEGMTEEDCLQSIVNAAMPEKLKENKTKNVMQEIKGGAEIFIPKKNKNKKTKFPKGFDPKNPGLGPDPERWLPKWQRSRFKKYAKKKGVYLKGAQGDAQIDTDVTSGNISKSTTHIEAASGQNKRRKR